MIIFQPQILTLSAQGVLRVKREFSFLIALTHPLELKYS
jgi:hypothetical protein